MSEKSTFFGFEKISRPEKEKRVNDIFTHVASFYDEMNDLMSFGLHHSWKRHAVSALDSYPNDTIADISCGSGDIAKLVLPTLTNGRLLCIDPNEAMLEKCKQRLEDPKVDYICSFAETLNTEAFHRAIISFGLRNFSDPILGLSNIKKHLKPGGKLVILEFNPPKASYVSLSYHCYLEKIIPFLGDCYANDKESYQYLADSIMTQPTPQERQKMLTSLGYQNLRYTDLALGVVGLFEAYV